MRLLIFINIIWLIFAPIPYAAASSSEDVNARYISMALQGDLSRAGQLFAEADMDNETAAAAELAVRFRSRFVDRREKLSPESGDTLIDAIITTYREYWTDELMRPSADGEGDDALEHRVNELLHPDQTGLSEEHQVSAFARLGNALQDRGFFYLEAEASPLRDLFLWKQEETKNYDVRLTDTTQPVSVTFMREIYSLGWKEFATLGLVSTTGWVDGDRLYCISWAYDRESENFKISYLKHEARHLADLKRYPSLSSADLEYRAKLTELAFASNTMHRLLDDFTSKSAPNPSSPHAWANFRVVRDVYRSLYSMPVPDDGDPWVNVNPNAVARTARTLLEQNTASQNLQD